MLIQIGYKELNGTTMKIYLAATAPGNESSRERGMLYMPRRLLSYYYIVTKLMENNKVFQTIQNYKEEQNVTGKVDS